MYQTFWTAVINQCQSIMSLCNEISLRKFKVCKCSAGCDWIPHKTEGETLDNHHPQDLGHCNDIHLMISRRFLTKNWPTSDLRHGSPTTQRPRQKRRPFLCLEKRWKMQKVITQPRLGHHFVKIHEGIFAMRFLDISYLVKLKLIILF